MRLIGRPEAGVPLPAQPGVVSSSWKLGSTRSELGSTLRPSLAGILARPTRIPILFPPLSPPGGVRFPSDPALRAFLYPEAPRPGCLLPHLGT